MSGGCGRWLPVALLCAAAYGSAHAADSDDSSTHRPLRIVVGFTPGGGPDITARHIADLLAMRLQRPVLVENRPGAGGTIAAQHVAASAPDGETLLSVSNAHAIAPAIYAHLPYDTARDFAGVTMTAKSKYVLVVAPGQPYATLAELIAYARRHPRALNFSSAGVGSGTHFAAELLKQAAHIGATHVPHKGIPEALTETMSRRAHFLMAPIANALPLVAARRLVAIGVSSPQRDALLPGVPAIAEIVPGFKCELWFGVLAPAKTPRAVVARLNRDIAAILRKPSIRARWLPLGLEPTPSAPEAFDRLIADELRRYTAVARSAGFRTD